jgi:DNA-binding NarL/FixJ family response regulator
MKSGDFSPFKRLFSREDEVVHECEAIKPEILLSEVAFGKNTDLKTRLAEAKEVRKKVPNCKIVFLCDENSAPDLAREVMQAKKDGLIDNFFYSSVGSRYLVAALTAM